MVVKTADCTCESDATGLEEEMVDLEETNQGPSPEEDLVNQDKLLRGKLEGTPKNHSLQDEIATSHILSKELTGGTQRGLRRA